MTKIYGVDFTSAPRRAKPITCAACRLDGDRLSVVSVEQWTTFAGFESFLQRPSRWTAALDFPFGQPRELIHALNWPVNWNEYVSLVGKMTKLEFVELMDEFRKGQPRGKKHLFRRTDEMAKSCSPMMLYGVPVGKMFFEGAPRLQRSDVSVLPCRPNDSERTVVEGYPALVAKRLINNQKYKQQNSGASDRSDACRQIVEGCYTNVLREAYGLRLQISEQTKRLLIDDEKGDLLDAVLCAVQAAAYELPQFTPISMPKSADSLEGWIADPTISLLISCQS